MDMSTWSEQDVETYGVVVEIMISRPDLREWAWREPNDTERGSEKILRERWASNRIQGFKAFWDYEASSEGKRLAQDWPSDQEKD